MVLSIETHETPGFLSRQGWRRDSNLADAAFSALVPAASLRASKASTRASSSGFILGEALAEDPIVFVLRQRITDGFPRGIEYK
jgi:hypothetical protein